MAAVLGRDNPEYQHTEQPQEMVEVRGAQEQEVGAGTRRPQEQGDMDRVRTVQQWPPPVE